MGANQIQQSEPSALSRTPELCDPAMQHGREVLRFTSFEDWRDHATTRFQASGYHSAELIGLDTLGRMVDRGAGFKQAQADNTYPVRFFLLPPRVMAAGASSQSEVS